jgi:hypothetical protein
VGGVDERRGERDGGTHPPVMDAIAKARVVNASHRPASCAGQCAVSDNGLDVDHRHNAAAMRWICLVLGVPPPGGNGIFALALNAPAGEVLLASTGGEAAVIVGLGVARGCGGLESARGVPGFAGPAKVQLTGVGVAFELLRRHGDQRGELIWLSRC